MPIPIIQTRVGASQPRSELMQKQSSIFPPQEVLQHLFRLPSAALHIHGLQNRHNIFEQKFGIITSSV